MTEPTAYVLITRPQPQADRWADELRAALPGAVKVIVSPLMRMQRLAVQVPQRLYDAVILTSEAGALAAGALRPELPGLAHCVGPRTAETARQVGFKTGEVAPTATDLLPRLTGAGRMLYLHGQDVSVRMDLLLEGVDALAVYAQVAEQLNAQALAALGSGKALLVPLFSARSARLFFAECPKAALAAVRPCVIAEAVGHAVPQAARGGIAVAETPDGAGMMAAIRQAATSVLP